MKLISKIIIFVLISISGFSQNQVDDFTVIDTDGNTHNLYSILDNGQKVVLDFFFVGCSYCELYSPMIQQSYENFGCNSGDVFFMGIDWGDTDLEVMEFDSIYGLEYPSVSGIEGGGDSVVNQFNITAFTTLMVIDTNKQIIKVIDPPTTANIDSFLILAGAAYKSCNTSIIDERTESKISIINPVNGNLIINSGISSYFNIQIIDINGRILLKDKRLINKGFNKLDYSAILKKGIYLIRLINHEENFSYKLLVR